MSTTEGSYRVRSAAMQATVETLVGEVDTLKQNANTAPYKRGGLYGTCSFKSDNNCMPERRSK